MGGISQAMGQRRRGSTLLCFCLPENKKGKVTKMSEGSSLKRTPLYEAHKALGARLIEFGGWEMPVQYSGILEEHRAVREKAGIFDLSHMGEIAVTGPQAFSMVQKVTTNDASTLEEGQVQYSVFCRPTGGIVDDLLVYRRRNGFWLVVNASNSDKDHNWLLANALPGANIANESEQTALIGVQGPLAARIVQPVVTADIQHLGYYHFIEADVLGSPAVVSRTGYTGEDGFELYVRPEVARAVWDQLFEIGAPLGMKPVGLGARDTLRLEMKYTLYGNDIGEETNPLEAGLGWVVRFDKGDFIGREALLAIKEAGGPSRRLVGFELEGRGVPRHGYTLWAGAEAIGEVTSGTVSPTLNRGIGTGYVRTPFAKPGAAIDVDIRGQRQPARVIRTPFVPSSVNR